MKGLNNLIGRILGTDKLIFSEIWVEHEVIDAIINVAKNSYPNEFAALLEGKIKDKVLHIEGLIFLPGTASDEGAVMEIFMMPLISDAVGSVHSHPGYSASPSAADLQFFSKRGFFHMIIAEPYTEDSIRAYDSFGNSISYKII